MTPVASIKRVFIIVLFTLTSCAVASGQISKPDDTSGSTSQTSCPTITVDCPTTRRSDNQIVEFKANVSGADPSLSLSYRWELSAGKIVSGQGTPILKVDISGIDNITAIVEVGGLPVGCPRNASCTTPVALTMPPARKFEDDDNLKSERARLDRFAQALEREPGSQGYVIVYGGRRWNEREIQARADRVRNYLVNSRGIDAGRVVTVNGGLRESVTIELWIVPAGAMPPKPSPIIQNTETENATKNQKRTRRRHISRKP